MCIRDSSEASNYNETATEDDGSCLYCGDLDVCFVLDEGDLNYSSDVNIYGFQFDHNGCVTSASGGEAADAGFTVSASAATVLGFSFTGSSVPAGSNLTLVELGGNISEECLSDFVISGPGGTALSSGFASDTNCASGVFDCDGVCDGTATEDCAGECGGSSESVSYTHLTLPTRSRV